MINISKFVAIGSLLLFGANANLHQVSDWDSYELGLELKDFYDTQNDMALCKMDCMYAKDDYMGYFDDECNICVPEIMHDSDTVYCRNKENYEMSLDGYYKEMTEIIKWDHEIQNIETSEYVEPNEYGYGELKKSYTVTVKLNVEYIYGQCTV